MPHDWSIIIRSVELKTLKYEQGWYSIVPLPRYVWHGHADQSLNHCNLQRYISCVCRAGRENHELTCWCIDLQTIILYSYSVCRGKVIYFETRIHLNGNVILTKHSSLVALGVVKMTTWLPPVTKIRRCHHLMPFCRWLQLVTSQWRHNERVGVSNHQPHHCLLNRFIKAQIKENINSPRHWPLCGEFTSNRWIPHTESQ